jgi:hypothetical protein
MPKSVLKIDKFHGGINNDADPRDIADIEMVSLTDVDISSVGRIKMLGGFTEHESTSGAVDGDADAGNGSAGTGLFSWSSDYRMLADDEDFDGGAEQRTDYIALYEDTSSTSKLALFQKQVDGEKGWEDGGSTFALGGATGEYSFYAVDGNLRVFDYSGVAYAASANNKGKWLGVITPKLYSDDSGGATRDYGSWGTTYATDCLADAERTGGSSTYLPRFNKQLGVATGGGCFPEDSNGDGDQCTVNAIAHSGYSQWTKVHHDGVSFSDDASNPGTVTITSATKTIFQHFSVGDKVSIKGFSNTAYNRHNVTLTAATNTTIEMAGVGGSASESAGNLIEIKIIETNGSGDYNQVAGAALAGEGSDIGPTHDAVTAGTTSTRWGASLIFAEDTAGNDTGTWMPSTNTRYKFYISTVYDNGTQESLPQLMAMYGARELTNGDDEYDLSFKGSKARSEVYFHQGVTDANRTKAALETQGQDIALHIKPILKITGASALSSTSGNYAFGAPSKISSSSGDPRVSGVKFYYSSSEDGHADLWTIFDCDFHKGTKSYGMDGTSGTGGRAPWQHYSKYYDSDFKAADGHYIMPDWNTGNKFINPPKLLSYYTANQHEHTDAIILNHAKSFVVANNRVYAGNYNQTIDGVPTQFSDRIIMSPVRQPDKFPQNNFIPTAINDGDEIVTLAVYNDRLLQFNKNVLYIHNISQAESYLEDTYKFKGVLHPASVCTTDNGIAWANEKGAYLYTGSKVVNLIEKNAQHIISPSTWSTFSDTPMVGYISDKRQLLFADDISNTGDGAIYIYDLVTSSWVKGADASILANIKTNFANDYNGDLIYYDYTNAKMEKWNSSANTGALSILTKDIDFGSPAVRKKIYKAYITYKRSTGDIPVVYYDTDGNTTLTTAATIVTGFTDATNQWARAEFTFGDDANNCFSFQLKLSGATNASFEINDISIVYRMKRIK